MPLKVMQSSGRGSYSDIAAAVNYASNKGAKVINLSLGGSVGSEVEKDAILDAFERGTICVCAAGNSAGAVIYPAAFKECIAVSALGLEGWAPAGTVSASRLPLDSQLFGYDNLYLANFSCFGEAVAACSPGVGIISTFPQRYGLAAPYGAMDGTSMASPLVTGVMAVLLSRSNGFTSLPRGDARARAARAILRKSCRDVGLEAVYQGAGIATLNR